MAASRPILDNGVRRANVQPANGIFVMSRDPRGRLILGLMSTVDVILDVLWRAAVGAGIVLSLLLAVKWGIPRRLALSRSSRRKA